MHRILAVGIHEHLGTSLQRLIPDKPDNLTVFETVNLERALDMLEAGETFQLIIACLSSYDLRELANVQRLRERHSDTMILTLFDVGGDFSAAQSTIRRLLATFRTPLPAITDASSGPRPQAMDDRLPDWHGDEPSSPSNPLTARQMEVLYLLRDGKSNKEIARTLRLAEGTIKVHCMAIFRELGVVNRTQAAIAAERIQSIRA